MIKRLLYGTGSEKRVYSPADFTDKGLNGLVEIIENGIPNECAEEGRTFAFICPKCGRYIWCDADLWEKRLCDECRTMLVRVEFADTYGIEEVSEIVVGIREEDENEY